MDRTLFEYQADFCRAMGNATRLLILHTLREGSLSVNELAQKTDLSQPMVSRQLGILRSLGLVLCERHGKEMVYHIADPKIVEVCDLVRQVLHDRFMKTIDD